MSLQQVYYRVSLGDFVNLPEGWRQGRTIYGGLIAGLMIEKAMINLDDPAKKLLNANITFVGPVEFAEIRLTAEILRQGKYVTTIEVRVWQNDVVQSILVASFGLSRESVMQVDQAPQAPEYPHPETLTKLPFYEGFTPEFYNQFEMCWAEGFYPYVGKDKIDFGGWFRFNPSWHQNRAMTLSDFMVMLDIWPAGVYPKLKMPVPTSTLTWNITFLQPLESDMYDWIKYKMHTDYAGDGYLRESEYLWDQNDRLIAISRQTLTIFA